MFRKHAFVPGEIYHVYNRGVNKSDIFLNESDYLRFLILLYLCNDTEPVHMANLLHSYQGRSLIEIFKNFDKVGNLVDIGAYCLMPTHFHILIREKESGGVTAFMKKLATGYSMYFNKKNDRTGSLFEGRFKTKHVNDEAYLNWLFSYIHLNPVKLIDSGWKENGIGDPVGARKFMDEFRYSSYYDYFLGDRPEKVIINKEVFPESFSELNDFQQLIDELAKDGDK